jgi:hypothetical protein
MTPSECGSGIAAPGGERSTAGVASAGNRRKLGPRGLEYEEIIARAKAERAAVILAFLRSILGRMKLAGRPRSTRTDRFTRAHARPDT